MGTVKLQAHRGVSSEYPENTLRAFQAAINQGYDFIEIGLAVTKDGKIGVLHDDKINRTGRNPDGSMIQDDVLISQITYAEACHFDFGVWFSKKFKGEKIPLLTEVLELAAKNNITLKIDNKVECFSEESLQTLFEIVKDTEAKVAFTCDKVEIVSVVKKNMPNAWIHYDGTVTENVLEQLGSIVCKDKLMVWIPVRQNRTVETDTKDKCLAVIIKNYAALGVWNVLNRAERDWAVNELHADVIETDGRFKPYKRKGYIMDLHIHSEHSHDGNYSVRDMCERAINKGMNGISITDHCDVEYYDTLHMDKVVIDSTRDQEKAKLLYKDRLEIFTGVEMGEGIWYPEVTAKFEKMVAYDQIIGSVHAVKRKGYSEPYSKIDFSNFTEKVLTDYMNCYFEDMMLMLMETEFDILAHLTCPFRYINGKYGKNLDWRIFKKQIQSILKYIIEHGIALEVNTSCKGSNYDELMPEEEILRLYVDMGGYLVTFGSDAHVPENIAHRLEETFEVLRKCGLEYLVYFKNRNIFQYMI